MNTFKIFKRGKKEETSGKTGNENPTDKKSASKRARDEDVDRKATKKRQVESSKDKKRGCFGSESVHTAVSVVRRNGLWLGNRLKFQDHRGVVLAAVQNNGLALLHASERLRDDFEVVSAAMRQNHDAIKYASSRLRQDREMLLLELELNPSCAERLSFDLKSDSTFIRDGIERISSRPFSFLTLRPLCRVIREHHNDGMMELMVMKFPWTLQLASVEQQDSAPLVSKAVAKVGVVLSYASPRLRADPIIVSIAVSNAGSALKYASPLLQDSQDLVRAAVEQDGRALQFASDVLQDNEAVVRVALISNGSAFEFASSRLQEKRLLLELALQSSGMAIVYASTELANDVSLVKQAICKERASYELVQGLTVEMLDNLDVMMIAVQHDGLALSMASLSLRDNKQMVLQALKTGVILGEGYCNYGNDDEEFCVFYYASDRLKSDLDIICAGLKENLLSASLLPDVCKNDVSIMAVVAKMDNETNGLLEYGGWKECCGSSLSERLETWIASFGSIAEWLEEDSGNSMEQLGQDWLREGFERCWLLSQIIRSRSLPLEVTGNIRAFLDFPKDVDEARETLRLGPLLEVVLRSLDE